MKFLKAIFGNETEEEYLERVGRYYVLKICKKCKHELTDKEIYDNLSVCCKYCGHLGNGILMDYKRIVIDRLTGKPKED